MLKTEVVLCQHAAESTTPVPTAMGTMRLHKSTVGGKGRHYILFRR
jgi:hypothetical protein